MEKVTIIDRPCHMRYNKRTGTYTVVRGSSYIKKTVVKTNLV